MLRSLILWFGLVASAQVMQIGILTVPVSGPPAAATPTFSPSAGTYSSAQTVTISTSTSGCSGYLVYNTTGASSGGNLTGTTAYSTPVSVSTTSTLYAQVQSCPSYTNSGIGSAAYTIILGPTLVQGCAATGLVCTFGSAITAGNQLYLCLNYANSGSTTWSGDSGTFTPDPGNGTAVTNIQYYGASDGRLTCIYVPTTGGGGTAISASNSGSFPAIVGLEVHNGTFDKSDNGVSAGCCFVSPTSSGSITPTANNALLIGVGVFWSGSGISAGTNVAWVIGANNANSVLESFKQTTAASILAQYVNTGNTASFTHIVDFK